MKTKVGMHVRKMATTDILSNSTGGRGKSHAITWVFQEGSCEAETALEAGDVCALLTLCMGATEQGEVPIGRPRTAIWPQVIKGMPNVCPTTH